MCGQVKEAVTGECIVCRRIKGISFYSILVCSHCHECPECHTPAHDCLQTEPYICLATRESRTGVRCTKCGASWGTRTELDRVVIHQAYTEAAPICRVCGNDVYHPHHTAWGKKGAEQPCICQDCLDCPTCKAGALFQKLPGGDVRCQVCKTDWKTAREFEQDCRV